jgi:hypothetical protein
MLKIIASLDTIDKVLMYRVFLQEEEEEEEEMKKCI